MIIYILKSTFCLVLLLGVYHLFLEKEKMHKFNRFYLLGSILFSFIVPSFTITVAPTIVETPVFTEISTLEQLPINEIPQESINETIHYTQYILGVYILVSLILFILLSKKIYSLLIKVKRNQQLNYFTATVVLLKERIVPYTFLHYIFVNKFNYQTDSLEQQILTHELAHVEQKHSIDVLLIEVLQNLFWFNPIFKYYKKAIQLNHEFLADDAVINSHKNITEYQQVLLNTIAQNNNIYLASNLNYSLTKKRLLMMTTPSSKTKILLKKLLVAPLVAGFIFAFAQRVEAQENKDTPQVVEEKLNENSISENEMNEYKELITKAENDRIYMYKSLVRMKDLYRKMSTSQQNSVKDIYKIAPPQTPIIYNSKTPTTKIFNSWKNNSKFAIWIDGKNEENSKLNNLKNTDIAYYTGSKVYKNARSKRFPQEFQFRLYTKPYFAKMKSWEKKKYEKITRIHLNQDGNLNINNSYTSFINDLNTSLDKLKIDKRDEHLVMINYDKKTPEKYLKQLRKKLRDYGIYKISTSENSSLFENSHMYNLVVKEIEKSKTYKKSQLDYLKRLYNNMSDQEKTKAVKKPSMIKLPPKPQVIKVVEQQKTRFHKNWFITIDGQKYYYTFDKKERIARYYKNGKLAKLNIVKEYKKKYKIFKRLQNSGKHYVFKTKSAQKVIDREFSDLGGMYFRMPRADKNKVSYPNAPSRPYVTLWKNGQKFYKKKGTLTKEDRLLMMPPPPPPNASKKDIRKAKESMKAWRKRTGQKPQIREVKPVKIEVIKNKNGLVEVIETPTSKSDKKKLKEYKKKHRIKDLVEVVEVKDSKVVRDVKELVEVRELKEVQDERPEIVEVQEIKELEETQEVVELMELKEIPTVVEIQEKPISVKNVPASKSPIEFVKIFARRGAKFTYNKKKISSKKAIRLVKSNKKLYMHPVKNKDKSIEIHISDKPFVKELIKEKK